MNTKLYGKVIEYNELVGIIIGNDGVSYSFSRDNVIDANIGINSVVSFTPDYIYTEETRMYIARNVSLVKKRGGE